MLSTRLVRVTHPFHPFSGQAVVCVGERANLYGPRLLLALDDGTVCAIPRPWTDLVAPDPEVVMGNGRALMRLADLLELAKLVDRLQGRGAAGSAKRCQPNCAAHVSQTTPHHVTVEAEHDVL
jgi:hypothetical protein